MSSRRIFLICKARSEMDKLCKLTVKTRRDLGGREDLKLEKKEVGCSQHSSAYLEYLVSDQRRPAKSFRKFH